MIGRQRVILRAWLALPVAMTLSCPARPLVAFAQASTDASNAAASLEERLISELTLPPDAKASVLESVRTREYRRAESVLLATLSGDTHSLRARAVLVLLGNIYNSASDYPQAVIAWSKADAISPLDNLNRFRLATTEIHVGRSDLARKHLQMLAEENENIALYQYWLARLDYDAQQYKSAILRLERTVKLEPGMARGYDLLGLCHDFEGDFDAAAQAYSIAVRLNRKSPHPSPWPPLDFATTLSNLNRLSEATDLLHEAIGYDPSNPKAHYELGHVEELRGDSTAAIEELLKSTSLDGKYAEPHYALARIYRRIGNREAAATELDSFKSLTQTNVVHP